MQSATDIERLGCKFDFPERRLLTTGLQKELLSILQWSVYPARFFHELQTQ
jgi:hypothetical protein